MSKLKTISDLNDAKENFENGQITYSEYMMEISLLPTQERDRIKGNEVIDEIRNLLYKLESAEISNDDFINAIQAVFEQL